MNTRKLIIGILMFGLILGTSAIAKADFDIHLGHRGYGYGSYHDRDFWRWDDRQRDRIRDAYRERLINEHEFNRLNREFSYVESFHDRAFSNGKVSPEDETRLERMQARLSADIDREISEHAG